MFRVLGDREAQNRIRARSPDGRHCRLLVESPNACIGCDDNPAGKLSPEEYFEGSGEDRKLAALAAKALRAAELADAGYPDGGLDLIELEAALIARRFLRRKERTELATEIALALSKGGGGAFVDTANRQRQRQRQRQRGARRPL